MYVCVCLHIRSCLKVQSPVRTAATFHFSVKSCFSVQHLITVISVHIPSCVRQWNLCCPHRFLSFFLQCLYLGYLQEQVVCERLPACLLANTPHTDTSLRVNHGCLFPSSPALLQISNGSSSPLSLISPPPLSGDAVTSITHVPLACN